MRSARKLACAKRRPALGLALGLALSSCQNGQLVTLGLSDPAQATGGDATMGSGGAATGGDAPAPTGGLGGSLPWGDLTLPLQFEDVQLVAELSSREKDDNPTLTADQLLLCFTSIREGPSGDQDQDVWCASRDTTDERFDEPVLIDPINSDVFETSPALSLDGLSLWFSSDRDGGQGGADIYVSRRSSRTEQWGSPALVQELNSEFDDIPRPPAMGNTVMPLGSRRTNDTYWTYLATRASPNVPFLIPELLDELTAPNIIFVDAQLSENGLLILFTTVAEDKAPADIYSATRTTLDEPFGAPVLIEGVNSPQEDRDPWLSPDGRTLYFSSDRSGDYEIYRATRVPSTK